MIRDKDQRSLLGASHQPCDSREGQISSMKKTLRHDRWHAHRFLNLLRHSIAKDSEDLLDEEQQVLQTDVLQGDAACVQVRKPLCSLPNEIPAENAWHPANAKTRFGNAVRTGPRLWSAFRSASCSDA